MANAAFLVASPVLALLLLEFYTHVPWDLTPPIFFLNLLFYYLLYGILTCLFGSSAWGYAVAPLLVMLFGLANYLVVDARSSPILPWDLYSIRTAVSVAGNYEYEITPRVVWVVLGFLLLAFLGSRTRLKIKKWRVRIPMLAGFAAGMALYVASIGSEKTVEAVGLDTTLFTPNVLYRNNGIAAGFLGTLKYLMVEKPEGYAPEAVMEAAAPYIEAAEHAQASSLGSAAEDEQGASSGSAAEDEQGASSGSATEDEQGASSGNATENAQSAASENGKDAALPNIVVIMDEAFSDLSVFGAFETDMDYMPFLRSLTEHTVKGNCYVSVKGGNTANSEYEFLTGDTMAFLPVGSVPYQQYIKQPMPSVANHLKNLGYHTVGIHPYLPNGWFRDQVYPMLGFDEALFRPDFDAPRILRGYVSDDSAFAKIMEQFEAKEPGEPLFVFEVTMQNHGGYSKDSKDFHETVHLTQLPDKTTSVRAAEKYLTLMLETDRAFETLVSYFSHYEEDTVVLLFGDHQPSDYITNTFLRLLGKSRADEEVFFDNYVVPFVMWANFDIGQEQVDAISLNYLSGLLLEKAGVPLSAYQTYLQELRQEIPAITANMVYADGERLPLDEGLAAKEDLLGTYNLFTYNHLSDPKHRVQGFYE